MSLLTRTRKIVTWAQGSPTRLPARVTISATHVLDGPPEPEPFRPDVHYFQVRVNEMFLQSSRQWFAQYDPMVLVVSEFVYDKKVQAVPVVVGPSMLEKYGQKLPAGMILADTRVAGPHPYKGGRLNLAVVLSQVETENYGRRVLKVLESAAGLSFATGLGAYLPIAGVVLDGLEALMGNGDVKPLLGLRSEFDPDGGTPFVPSWFALIDKPEEEIDPEQLWVRGGRLLHGADGEAARAFRDADFVLYSIGQHTETSEIETLPFYPLWERVQEAATKSGKDEGDPNWESARSDMRSLYQTLLLSPDLTETQAEALADTYVTRAQALRAKSVRIAQMAPEDLPPAERELQQIRGRIGGILED